MERMSFGGERRKNEDYPPGTPAIFKRDSKISVAQNLRYTISWFSCLKYGNVVKGIGGTTDAVAAFGCRSVVDLLVQGRVKEESWFLDLDGLTLSSYALFRTEQTFADTVALLEKIRSDTELMRDISPLGDPYIWACGLRGLGQDLNIAPGGKIARTHFTAIYSEDVPDEVMASDMSRQYLRYLSGH